MRTPAFALAAAILFAAAPARTDDEGARVVRGIAAIPVPWDDASPADALADEPDVPDDLLSAAASLRTSAWRATIAAVRVPYPTSAAAGVVAAHAPLLSAEDLAAVRTAVRERDAEVEHVLAADGRAGDTVVCVSGGTFGSLLANESDSAIGSAGTWTRAGVVATGVTARVTVAPAGARRWRVRIAVRWSDAPSTATARWVDDEEIETAAVRAFLAETTFDVSSGATAVLRASDPSRAARLLLVRVDGDAPDVPPVTAGSWGWFGAPGVAEELAEDAQWPTDDLPPSRDVRERAIDAATEPLGGAWLAQTVGGLRIGRMRGEGSTADVESAVRARRGVGALEATGIGGLRVVLPLAPGSTFRAFLGTIETRFGEITPMAGCDTSLVVCAYPVLGALGFGIAGAASPDGTVDADLVTRELLSERTFEAVGRRDLEGHVRGAPLHVHLPLRRVREVSVGGAVTADEPRFGPQSTVRFLVPDETRGAADPWARPAPVPLAIGGTTLAVRMGGHARLVDRVRFPFVRRWTADGWCGLRARYPVVDDVPQGTDVALSLSEDGADAGIVAEIRGLPERVERFDAQDGTIDVVRSPYLRFAAQDLALPADGVLASTTGLALRVRCGTGTGTERRVLRFGDASALADARGRVDLEAGSVVNLPTDSEVYDSNHQTGEVRTGVRLVHEGVRATLERAADGARPLAVEWRSAPRWTRRSLRIATIPERDGETHLAHAWVERSARHGAFAVPEGRAFRREPLGSLDLPLLTIGSPTSPGGVR